MPELRLRLSDDDYKELEGRVANEGTTLQDYVRSILFNRVNIFTPAVAYSRAVQKLQSGDEFTLPDLYTEEEWTEMSRGSAGAFGKAFFNYVTDTKPSKIVFCDGGNKGRRAKYKMI